MNLGAAVEFHSWSNIATPQDIVAWLPLREIKGTVKGILILCGYVYRKKSD